MTCENLPDRAANSQAAMRTAKKMREVRARFILQPPFLRRD